MPFTFVFKYWLRKALVMAHAFYSHISLEILVQFKEKGTVHSCIISVRDVLHFEFKDYPFFAVMKSLIAAKITAALFSGQRHSAIRRQIYVNFIFMQIAFTVSLCVLRMYALLYAYEKSPLVYPKFCAQIECFSWATRNWSRGWNSCQGDGVKTRRPRHLQRSCPLDNHSKICQLSELSMWLMAWVLLAQRMPILLLSCRILSMNTVFFSILEFSAALLIPVFLSRGRDLDLDGNASWMFWIPISFKIQAGVFLGFATLEKYAYGSILMNGHRWFAVINQTMDYSCPLHAYSMHRQPPLNTLGSITYYSATRVRISNTHLWRFWPCWSRHKCSTGSFAWARGVVSALFESCCWSEYIRIWSDGFR